jgi:hypothetical protein
MSLPGQLKFEARLTEWVESDGEMWGESVVEEGECESRAVDPEMRSSHKVQSSNRRSRILNLRLRSLLKE